MWVTDMNEEQKMFKIGVWSLVGIIFIIVALQVCYRTQHKSLKVTHDRIVEIQKKFAIEQAKFESMTNFEYLRDRVESVSPHIEIIGFKKYTEIEDLPLRKQ